MLIAEYVKHKRARRETGYHEAWGCPWACRASWGGGGRRPPRWLSGRRAPARRWSPLSPSSRGAPWAPPPPDPRSSSPIPLPTPCSDPFRLYQRPPRRNKPQAADEALEQSVVGDRLSAVAVAVVGTGQARVVYSMDRAIATGGEMRWWWAPPRSGTKETGEAGTAGGGGSPVLRSTVSHSPTTRIWSSDRRRAALARPRRAAAKRRRPTKGGMYRDTGQNCWRIGFWEWNGQVGPGL